MKIPFVNLPIHVEKYKNEINKIVEEVILDKADFILRYDLNSFEEDFAKYVGVKNAIGVANGSDALNLCLVALDLGLDDEIITVSHTFVATIAAIHHCNATPILIDVADDYNMDVQKIEEAITERTKAIIPVHLNGRVCNMDKIMEIADKYDLSVIEDAAQAMGATFNGRKAGSFGKLATTSFYPFKMIGCFGDGGMIFTNSNELDKKLRFLRDNGQDRSTGEIKYYGWNSRLDNLQAAFLTMKLKNFDNDILRRRKIAQMYTQGLDSIEDLILPPCPDTVAYYDVFQNYVIRTKKRNELVKYLNENEVGTLISWPIPTHFHKNLNLQHFSIPNTESISKEVVSLPMNTEISDERIKYVIEVVRGFFN